MMVSRSPSVVRIVGCAIATAQCTNQHHADI
jgi:hypothetical protein